MSGKPASRAEQPIHSATTVKDQPSPADLVLLLPTEAAARAFSRGRLERIRVNKGTNMKSDLAEPRSQVIFRHTLAAFRTTSFSPMQHAIALADIYQARVAPHERIVEFHVGTTVDTMEKAKKANLQIVSRFLNGTVKLPVDLEESWVASLPTVHRHDCERELAQRYGFLGARTPPSDSGQQLLCAAQVAIEFGELLQRTALVVDGRVRDGQDVAELINARKEGMDLLAAVTTLLASIGARLEQDDCQAHIRKERVR